MTVTPNTAVEITKRDDSLDIWVDANDNGIRDDDDVNIFVTAGGGFYTVSPTFRHALDSTIQGRIKELAIALLTQPQTPSTAHDAEFKLREMALELVVRATSNATPMN